MVSKGQSSHKVLTKSLGRSALGLHVSVQNLIPYIHLHDGIGDCVETQGSRWGFFRKEIGNLSKILTHSVYVQYTAM